MKTEILTPAPSSLNTEDFERLQQEIDGHSVITAQEWPSDINTDEALGLAWQDRTPDEYIGKWVMNDFMDTSADVMVIS